LNPADGIAFLVEEAMDAPGQIDVRRAIISAVARALHRPQLREAGLPIAQDVLGNAQFARQFADRFERARFFLSGRHLRISP